MTCFNSCVVVIISLFVIPVKAGIFFEFPLSEPLVDTPGKSIGSDFNGDGIHDLVVGADANADFGVGAGSVYILYGTSNLSATYDLSSLGGLDVTIQGKAVSDNLGYEVSSGGDLNADGFDDLLIGARNNDDAVSGAGAVFTIYGSPNLSATFRVSDTAGDMTILGKNGTDLLGIATFGIGDFNGDGFDDVIAGAALGDPYDPANSAGAITNAGAAYILYGGASLSQTYNISGEGVSVTLLGRVTQDQFGTELRGAGDVNLDGFDDVIVGARNNDDGGSNNEGAAYIFYGGSGITSGTTTRAGNNDVTIMGANTTDYVGRDVSGLSDINNDGFDDVIAGATGHDATASDAGVAFIVYGRRSLSGTVDTASFEEDISLLGKAVATENFGRGLSGIGDVNDDGYYDFIVGARVSNDAGTDRGSAYVFYGGTSLPKVILAGNNDVTITGRNNSDELGRAATGVGDINDDGIPDITVGALKGDGVTTDAGAAYIVFGGESISTSINLAGAGANVTIVGKDASDQLGLFIGGGHMNRGP